MQEKELELAKASDLGNNVMNKCPQFRDLLPQAEGRREQ